MSAILALVIAVVAAAMTPPVHAQTTEGGEPVRCETQHVLLLLDESGSLRRTDPEGKRVEAATVLVEALSPQEADRPSVSLGIAGFGTSYHEYGKFVLPTDRDRAIAEVARFRERHDHVNTDYVTALRAASAHFAPIEAPLECKTLLWFTDGSHDLERPDDPASQASGYTLLTNPDDITRQLEALVCGPLPQTALLPQPVREEVVAAGFRTHINELQSANPGARERELQGITRPVLDRLVRRPGDSCAIPGEWTTVTDADALVSRFFVAAQKALGKQPIPCAVLTDGHLRSDVVHSLAFRLQGGTGARLELGDRRVEAAGRAIDVDVTDTDRSQRSIVKVNTAGRLTDCFADLRADLRFKEPPVLYEGASATAIDLVLAGQEPAITDSIGPDLVELRATADGAPLVLAFDHERRVWTATLSAASSEPVELKAEASLVGGAEPARVLARLEATLEVSSTPPAPSLSWKGPEEFEGEGVIGGAIRLTPQISVEGAEYCVTVAPESIVRGTDPDDGAVAVLRPSEPRACFPAIANRSIDLPAELIVEEEANVLAVVAVEYSAVFRDPSGTEVEVAAEEERDIARISLVRSPDRTREILVLSGLVTSSALLPLLLLWLLNARIGRLADPTSLVALPLDISIARSPWSSDTDSSYVLSRVPEEPIRLADLVRVDGSRQRWTLAGGFEVKRRLPLIPFANPSARISCASGRLVSSVGQPRKDGTVDAPIRVGECLLIDLGDIATIEEAVDPHVVPAVFIVHQGLTVGQLEEVLSVALQRTGPLISHSSARRGASRLHKPSGTTEGHHVTPTPDAGQGAPPAPPRAPERPSGAGGHDEPPTGPPPVPPRHPDPGPPERVPPPAPPR